MSVNSKHVATFLLGLAAGVAANKYMNMSDEEKAQLADNIKSKANDFRAEAENIMDRGKEYFEELKEKGSIAAKEQMGSSIDDIISSLFGNSDNQDKASS